jgi:hypothetical protein
VRYFTAEPSGASESAEEAEFRTGSIHILIPHPIPDAYLTLLERAR